MNRENTKFKFFRKDTIVQDSLNKFCEKHNTVEVRELSNFILSGAVFFYDSSLSLIF